MGFDGRSEENPKFIREEYARSKTLGGGPEVDMTLQIWCNGKHHEAILTKENEKEVPAQYGGYSKCNCTLVQMKIIENRIVSLSGPTGSGKSTKLENLLEFFKSMGYKDNNSLPGKPRISMKMVYWSDEKILSYGSSLQSISLLDPKIVRQLGKALESADSWLIIVTV